MGDKVNHPDHYQLGNGLETIDVIESLVNIEDFDIGESVKHIFRWKNTEKTKRKDDDINNAIWYLQHLLDHNKKEIKKEIDALNIKMNGGVM